MAPLVVTAPGLNIDAWALICPLAVKDCGENRFAWVVMLPAVATARAVTEEAAVTAWKKPAPLSSARAKQRAWNRTRFM